MHVGGRLISITGKQLYTLYQVKFIRPDFRDFSTCRHEHHEPTHIAVLGGGITGLATAYFLSTALPNADITIFEASPRLGGWLHSTQVDVGSGKVVFEQGPRTLRPAGPKGLITLNLIQALGLEDRLLMTSKNSVAAQNRFVYYPDHLVRMPGPGVSLWSNLMSALSEPIFKGGISEALTEVTRPKRSDDVRDESVGSFVSRRFGPIMADNLVSAVFHGIYAGDIYALSARAILPLFWEIEQRHGSLLRGYLEQGFRVPMTNSDLEIMKGQRDLPALSPTLEAVRRSSVFTFKSGIGELVDRLELKLREDLNVRILKNIYAERLILQPNQVDLKIKMAPQSGYTDEKLDVSFTHVISTIAGDKLAEITSQSPTPKLHSTLGFNSAVTVMVVNIFFSNPSILPVRGFGYLLPRSLSFQQNPERALGVIFDSDATIGQDNIPGTKVTVMLGGHWWDDFETYPDEHEGSVMARAILKRHLGIHEEPQAVRVSLQKRCIPQYAVGHDDRMSDANMKLKAWKGRLRVAGNSFTGVGLNDCIKSARDAAWGLAFNRNQTGLESFGEEKKWSWIKQEEIRTL